MGIFDPIGNCRHFMIQTTCTFLAHEEGDKKGRKKEYCFTQTKKLTSQAIIFLAKESMFDRKYTDGVPANKWMLLCEQITA